MASADSTIAKEGYAHNPEVNGSGNVPVTGGALMTGKEEIQLVVSWSS